MAAGCKSQRSLTQVQLMSEDKKNDVMFGVQRFVSWPIRRSHGFMRHLIETLWSVCHSLEELMVTIGGFANAIPSSSNGTDVRNRLRERQFRNLSNRLGNWMSYKVLRKRVQHLGDLFQDALKI
uniref:Uncharacterized protein n=1 Tax=Vespula pensylvanica TaxID=30213 RepID=A0A834K114_VESPE|nr:hypothetical protein H0235_016085 [Vespula pensylvanica]